MGKEEIMEDLVSEAQRLKGRMEACGELLGSAILVGRDADAIKNIATAYAILIDRLGHIWEMLEGPQETPMAPMQVQFQGDANHTVNATHNVTNEAKTGTPEGGNSGAP